MDVSRRFEVLGYGHGGFSPMAVEAVLETSLRLMVNGREVAALQCTGMHPRYLSAGFLFCNGIIGSARDMRSLSIEQGPEGYVARVELAREFEAAPRLSLTSGQGLAALGHLPDPAPGRQCAPVCEPRDLLALAAQLDERSELYRATRGCHNSALCSAREILFFCSDIGRHNAMDTIAGKCLLEGLETGDKILLTTGRVSGEIALKAARCGFAVLASGSMATSLGADLAGRLGLALAGNVTPEGCLIYANNGAVAV